MRYGTTLPTFWTGDTGRFLRGHMEAQIVAHYLMTCSHSNMIGMYHIPLMYIAHETGLGLEGASKGLQRCIQGHFCGYDKTAEVAWVVNMMKYQTAPELKDTDKRVKGIQKTYEDVESNCFLDAFYEYYKNTHHVKRRLKKAHSKPLASPLQAPTKPETETETETETHTVTEKKPSFTDKKEFDFCGTIPADMPATKKVNGNEWNPEKETQEQYVDRLLREATESTRPKY